MKRATVTISDELQDSLEDYMRRQEVIPALTSVVQAALREYLTRRGYEPGQTFSITPSRKGSGSKDTSIRHDYYLAGK